MEVTSVLTHESLVGFSQNFNFSKLELLFFLQLLNLDYTHTTNG